MSSQSNFVNKDNQNSRTLTSNMSGEEYYYNIKCKNYKTCNGLLPDRWFEVRGRYLCLSCERIFRNLINEKDKIIKV
jgi:hypothetical protein